MIAVFAPPLAELALQVRPGRILLADGAGPGRRRRAGARARCSRRSAMIVLGLLLGLVGTDVNSGVPRFTFGIPRADRRHRLRRRRDGHVRLRRDHRQPRAGASTAKSFTDKVDEPVADAGRTSSAWPRRSCAARRSARSSASCRAAARCWPPSPPTRSRRSSRRIRDEFGKGAIEGVAGAGVGQQRRRADLVHPAADARHPVQRRDGADGRRDDHPGHPARARRS